MFLLSAGNLKKSKQEIFNIYPIIKIKHANIVEIVKYIVKYGDLSFNGKTFLFLYYLYIKII